MRLYGRIGQALIDAKQSGRDPFAAIEAVMSWDAFAESVTEAQKLAQPDDFDVLHRIGESYATLRRYAPEFLDVLKLRAAPAAKNVLDAIEVLRGMNTDNVRKVPADAPTDFIKPRWQKLVMTDAEIDRRYYELCVLSELKNLLRSGDIWVQGSRQFKDFEDYLVPPAKFASLKRSRELPLAVVTDCDQYLSERLELLEAQLATVNRMALANDLQDAIITESGLKIAFYGDGISFIAPQGHRPEEPPREPAKPVYGPFADDFRTVLLPEHGHINLTEAQASVFQSLWSFKGEPMRAERIMAKAGLESEKPIDVFKVKTRDKGRPGADRPLLAYRELVVTLQRQGLYSMPCALEQSP